MSRKLSLNFPYTLSLFTVNGIRGGRILLSLYALQLGASPITVGLLMATFSALPMMLAVQSGKVSDRFGPRWPLVLGIAGSATGIMVPFFFQSIPALFVAAVMNGFAFTFYNVSLQNTIGLLSTAENRVKNYANFSLVTSVANFTAPLLVGLSIDHFGYARSCLSVMLLAVIPVAMLVAWGGGLPKGHGSKKKGGATAWQSLREPSVWKVLLISSLLISGIDLFNFYMPVYAHGLGLSATTIGFILSSYAAAAFTVRMLLPWLINRFSMQGVLFMAFFVAAGGFILVPMFQNPVILCVIAFVFGLGASCGQPITMSLSFSNASEGRSGEAMGLRMTINHLTRVVGPMIFGSIGSVFGLVAVFWANAALLAAGGAMTRSGKIGPGAEPKEG